MMVDRRWPGRVVTRDRGRHPAGGPLVSCKCKARSTSLWARAKRPGLANAVLCVHWMLLFATTNASLSRTQFESAGPGAEFQA